jgi:hypothetical protein
MTSIGSRGRAAQPSRPMTARRCRAAPLANECANHTGWARTTIPELAPVLIGAPFWSFWWD